MAYPLNHGAHVSVDFKIPLWGLLTASGLGCLMIAGLYFNVQALTVAVTELQVTVKAGNTALVSVASENAMQNFRLGTIETEQARMNDILRAIQIKEAKQ
jgi:hypothetical protein